MTKAHLPLKSDNRPLYDQTIEAVNQFIEEGGYQPGDKLPGEAEFAKQLGISRPTLREAIGNLELYGVVKRRHGVGTFVTSPAQMNNIRGGLEQLVSLRALAENADIASKRKDWVVKQVAAAEAIAEKLEINPGDPIIMVQMTAVKEDGKLIAYMESHISRNHVNIQELKDYQEGSMLNYLLEHSTESLSYTQTNIYSISADKELGKWLEIPVSTPLLLLDETLYSDLGQPMMHEYNHFLTECMNFQITRRISKL